MSADGPLLCNARAVTSHNSTWPSHAMWEKNLLDVGKEVGLEVRVQKIKYIVTLTPIVRQHVGKQVPAKTDS
jgi:hypothetical protein